MKTTPKCLLSLVVTLVASLLSVAQSQSGSDVPPYKNPSVPVDQRVQDLLGRMTLQEKVAMLSGADWMQSVPNERLGIPSIKMADGPLGIRSWAGGSAETTEQAASTPASHQHRLSLRRRHGRHVGHRSVCSEGQAIAQEVKALGRDMILGPTVNINRSAAVGPQLRGLRRRPLPGRAAGVAYIKGVQGEGVISSRQALRR